MRHLCYIASILLILLPALRSAAQCTPNPMYADSAFGVWPDTIENFPSAEVGVYYSTVLDFKFPTDGGDVDQQYSGMPIDSGAVNSVTGLPPGMIYTCNNSHCSWLGGQQGCALIDGTCNQAGTYDIVINIDGWTHLLSQAILVPMSFSGYRINVWPVGIEEQSGLISAVTQSPNPFSQTAQITFVLNRPLQMNFSLFDLLGNRIESRKIDAVAGSNVINLENTGLGSGIYFFTLNSGKLSVTKRLVVE